MPDPHVSGGGERDAALRLRERLRAAGLALGLTQVGFAGPEEPSGSRRLLAWLRDGRHGSMAWMERDPEARVDPRRSFPGLGSVIAVSLRYARPEPVPYRPGAPRVSRYAWGDDYHDVLGEKLRAFDLRLREECAALRAEAGPEAPAPAFLPSEIRTRLACDTSPVMDKAWAAAAGLGWIGKNACLIHPREGSWLFLGEIFTNVPLPPDPEVEDRCGTCRRCLDACPAAAFPQPYVLDARRCISYLTIERRAEFTPEEERAVGEWLVGCDVCQEVCPWNAKAPVDGEERFAPRPELAGRSAADWAGLDDAGYRAAVRGTAVTRVKPWMMRRNARAVLANRRAVAGEGPEESG